MFINIIISRSKKIGNNMDVIEAIKTRKSVRSFRKKKVPLSTVKNILKLASLSPSGSNTQPWNVHIL